MYVCVCACMCVFVHVFGACACACFVVQCPVKTRPIRCSSWLAHPGQARSSSASGCWRTSLNSLALGKSVMGEYVVLTNDLLCNAEERMVISSKYCD